jgi:hypothetical protein
MDIKDMNLLDPANWPVSAQVLKYYFWASYALSTTLLMMVNESIRWYQWIIFSASVIFGIGCAMAYFYRLAVEKNQWLAITIVQFFLIVSMSTFFFAGALEGAKIYTKGWITVPLIISFLLICLLTYLSVKEARIKQKYSDSSGS